LTFNSSFADVGQEIYTDVLTNYLPLASLMPADSNGVMTGYVPCLPYGDINRAIVFVELMRVTPASVWGALVTGNPILLEVSDKRVVIKDDTFRVYPLKSYPPKTKCHFGAFVELQNWTI